MCLEVPGFGTSWTPVSKDFGHWRWLFERSLRWFRLALPAKRAVEARGELVPIVEAVLGGQRGQKLRAMERGIIFYPPSIGTTAGSPQTGARSRKYASLFSGAHKFKSGCKRPLPKSREIADDYLEPTFEDAGKCRTESLMLSSVRNS